MRTRRLSGFLFVSLALFAVPVHAQEVVPAPEVVLVDPNLPVLKWSGYIQGQFEMHEESEDELDPSTRFNFDCFLVRRGRIKLEARIFQHALFMMQIDATTSGVSLRDAVAAIEEPWTAWKWELAVGLFKNPWGFEVLQSSGDRVFPERSQVARFLFPGERDVGVRLKGSYGVLNLAFALVNGNPIGESLFPGRDPNSHKDLVGRVGVAAGPVEAGVSGYVGTQLLPGSPATEDPDTDEVPSENVNRLRLGGDVRLKIDIPQVGPFELLVEGTFAHVADSNRPTSAVDAFGGYVGVIQHWKDRFGVAFRFDVLDRNLDVNGDLVMVLEPVLLFYPWPAVRISLAYDIILEQDRNEEAALGGHVDNNIFTARMQVKF